jgi:hypothetical protein
MPRKGPGELTQDEVKLLIVAAKLMGALQEWAERPPAADQQVVWDAKAREELVHAQFTFC